MDRTVPVVLNNETFRLAYTMGALRFLKKQYGLTSGSLGDVPDDLTLLVAWTHAGLVGGENRPLTTDDVERLLDLTRATAVYEAITMAYAKALDVDIPVENPQTVTTEST